MNKHFGFTHDIDNGVIKAHNAGTIRIRDDSTSYSIPIAFVDPSQPVPKDTRSSSRPWAASALAASATFHAPEARFDPAVNQPTSEQLILYRKLGCPHQLQWRYVKSAMTGHRLNDDVRLTTPPEDNEALERGRSRAAPFYRPPLDAPQPPPGAKFYGDFAGFLLPSYPDGYTAYCGWVDAGSGYGRIFPCHDMTAKTASTTLAAFTADVGAKLNLQTHFKPSVIRTDNGSAFISHHFAEFCNASGSQPTTSAPYEPRQNSHIERLWGIIFGMARVYLIMARLPKSFHPFAIQCAVWVYNILPRYRLGNKSPVEIL